MNRAGFFVMLTLLLAACGGQNRQAAEPVKVFPTDPPKQLTGVLHYSFVAKYPAGSINDKRSAQSPNGRGAFVLSWPFGLRQATSLTVIDGYQYTYKSIAIGPNDQLTFEVAKPYALGTAVLAFVDVEDGGKITRVFARSIPPADPSGPIWQNCAVSLASYTGHHVNVTFGAATVKGGNQTAAWVAYANPAIFAIK